MIINFEIGPIPYGWINPPQAIFFGTAIQGQPIVISAASYRLLKDHWFANNAGGEYHYAGEIITEGREVPLNWVPTLDVDPLNGPAVTAYYAAGPRGHLGLLRQQWSTAAPVVVPPITYWKHTPSTNYYTLTGLGVGLPPIGARVGRIET